MPGDMSLGVADADILKTAS